MGGGGERGSENKCPNIDALLFQMGLLIPANTVSAINPVILTPFYMNTVSGKHGVCNNGFDCICISINLAL